jgi:16S rRNA (adenine1518-N6/adenine1519-N6)-dimethyltransferase
MDLLEFTKKQCQKNNINPARSKGQNFLISEKVYDKIIESAELKKNDIILEVGPGLGFLTRKLAKIADKVIAVELDDKLAKILHTSLVSEGIKNVKVLNEDVLKFQISDLRFKNEKFKIVANLPYNITSYFLRNFLSAEIKPELMVLMLQKEVAQRIVAKPGEMSKLSVSVQYYSRPLIVEIVKPNDFWPRPEVESAIVKFELIRSLPELNEKSFFRLVRIGFSSKRKMLKNNLAAGLHFSQDKIKKLLIESNIKELARAQDLSLDNWLELFGIYSKNVV